MVHRKDQSYTETQHKNV